MLALVTQYLHCIYNYLHNIWAFPGGSGVKNPPAKQETQVQSLGQEDPLEKGMATHSTSLENSMDGGVWWDIFFKYLFINLAVPGLSCSMWDLVP